MKQLLANATPSSKFEGLRRITSGGRLIPEIDGFRFLAILVVLIHHIHIQVALAHGVSWPSWLIVPDGGRGVFLFFTISGFILGLPFARRALLEAAPIAPRQFSYRAYLVRRVTRLEPPYVLTLLLRFILILAVFHSDIHDLTQHFFASLFYVHNLVFGTMSPVSPPTWSLEVEVQFYLLAPLFARVFLIRSAVRRRVLLVSVTFCFAFITQTYCRENERVLLSLAGNLQYFTAGLLLCDFFVTRPFAKIPTYAWDCLGIGALIPLLWNDARWTMILLPFGSLVVYLAGLHGDWVRRFFAAPAISVAGGMCYSIYLTHGTVLTLVAVALARAPIAALPAALQVVGVVGISLTVAFLVGAAFFVLIERPCMDPTWPQKVLASLRRQFRMLPNSLH